MNQITSQKLIAVALASGAATAVAVYSYLLWLQRKENKIPTEWKEVAKLTILNLYPLKSGRRVELQRALCTDVGLQQVEDDERLLQLRDRSFIVYDAENYDLKTARTFPKMVLIEVSVDDKNQIAMDAPGMDTLYVKIPKRSDKNVKELFVLLHHSERIWGLDCGNAAAEWMSKYIYDKPTGVRIAFNDGSEDHRRNITKTHSKYLRVFPKLSNKSTGMFSDLCSYHLINQASVDELATKCPEAVTVYNFRPPIVIAGSGAPAYAEDTWNYIRVGETAIFRTVQPCTRCVMTTIDQEKGERSMNREPLTTMNGYRKLPNKKQRDVDSSPVMGQYLELVRPGVINVGDAVYIGK